MIRKDYETDMNVYTNAMTERYAQQQRVKNSEVLLSKLSKGEYTDISEAFAIAVKCISDMRQEDVTGKTIIAKAKEKGLKTAVASVSKNAVAVLTSLGIFDKFDYIADAKKITKSKPDPEIFAVCADCFHNAVTHLFLLLSND